ncbi:MAG: hypothetical protein HOL39_00645 [Cryomorphaceae bacterium]|jgi:hypothetical protein|nr:hypothetical protein [Cryomorphaceae bacterium]MBT6546609.1 hypothetical protein [Cryomorphaceae bacterium]
MKNFLNFFVLIILIFPINIFAQNINSYNINANLNSESKTLEINQIMKFKNTSDISLKEIILEDWSNSYVDNRTNLAKRISDEYSRSFSFAKKKQRGSTKIKTINSVYIDSWRRSSNTSDIIEVHLNKSLKPGESIELEINYTVKLPDSKFTGYGFDNDNFYLKNWLIVFSNISNSNWYSQSNLNLDDQSLKKSGYKLKISFDKDYYLFSNLIKNNTEVINNLKSVSLSGSGIKDVRINLLIEEKYKRFQNNKNEIETDIFKSSSLEDAEIKVDRVNNFVKDYFNDHSNIKLLVPKIDYDSNPFYGLNQLPSFISPFSDEFLEEIIFLKSFVINYLNHIINLNKRESHWIYKGLEIFIINKYINNFYPNVKFLGRLSGISFLENYEISKIDFNDLFLNYSEYVQRLNLHQTDDQSSEYLTRINQEIASPYHSGVGLIYVENLIGEKDFRNLIEKINNINTRKELNSLFLNYNKADLSWFIDDYIGKRQSLDLKFKRFNKNELQVEEKNNISIPYSIGFLKNDSIIQKNNFEDYNKIEVPNIDFDYIVINPIVSLPESNKSNNWVYNKSKSNLKPLRIKLIGDLENPKYKALYLRPEVTYNLYDGISPGFNILNKGLKNKPFSYEVFTQYASKEETLVGSLNFKYQINNEVKNNYSTVFNLFYTTNHFDENLRYQVFSPSIRVNFRDNKNLRSKIKKSFTLSLFNVNKDTYVQSNNSLDNYSIYNLGYYYSDIGIIRYLKSSINTEFSDNFGKINLVFDYRKLLKSNRQFQARVYLGKFFWNNDQFDNFNYNLERSSGYLFSQNYLGRSERTGLLSQQFIMAGGGFKSFFNDPTTNNFILTSNLNVGIWKWIEGYLDIGILKDSGEDSRYYYGTGLRLNLLPDFFELYFPISSSNGFELNDFRYNNKIRFIVSYNLESLSRLFSRRWL